jgi:hypothetical protein
LQWLCVRTGLPHGTHTPPCGAHQCPARHTCAGVEQPHARERQPRQVRPGARRARAAAVHRQAGGAPVRGVRAQGASLAEVVASCVHCCPRVWLPVLCGLLLCTARASATCVRAAAAVAAQRSGRRTTGSWRLAATTTLCCCGRRAAPPRRWRASQTTRRLSRRSRGRRTSTGCWRAAAAPRTAAFASGIRAPAACSAAWTPAARWVGGRAVALARHPQLRQAHTAALCACIACARSC